MQINSVWHITDSGRSLRIDNHSDRASSKDVTVFTKHINITETVKEKTRIIPEAIVPQMILRKFLMLTDGTAISAGPFEVKLESVSPDMKRTNISINGLLLFLGFIPSSQLIIPFNNTVLLPADSEYYAMTDIDKVLRFISILNPCDVIISGDLSYQWNTVLLKKFNTKVVNEVIQNSIFK
ncbi:MAG TPA: hypothetical protein PKG52_07770 [bacterium]|nr:hypothetical protein [bacterium]HPS28908.1 hypothetical protein [bacterium]